MKSRFYLSMCDDYNPRDTERASLSTSNQGQNFFHHYFDMWKRVELLKSRPKSRSYCCGADCFSGSFINKPSLSRVRIGSIVRSGARAITSVVFLSGYLVYART